MNKLCIKCLVRYQSKSKTQPKIIGQLVSVIDVFSQHCVVKTAARVFTLNKVDPKLFQNVIPEPSEVLQGQSLCRCVLKELAVAGVHLCLKP